MATERTTEQRVTWADLRRGGAVVALWLAAIPLLWPFVLAASIHAGF